MVSKDESSYGHVLKYVGIFGGVQGLSILVGLVRNKVVAHFLGPDGIDWHVGVYCGRSIDEPHVLVG